jgi:acetyl esterase/lipase
MWGALLARVLTKMVGCIVVIPDYRNYPWGTIADAIDDVELALQWTIDAFPPMKTTIRSQTSSTSSPSTSSSESRNQKDVVLVGQSAGGHLLTTLLLRKAILQLREQQDTTSSPGNTILDRTAGLIALSAPLHVEATMANTFTRHGFGKDLLNRMFAGRAQELDPYQIVQQQQQQQQQIQDGPSETSRISLQDALPPIKIYHGSMDHTVPPEGSIEFANLLQAQEINASFEMYHGWSHTDAILEGVMDGDHRFHRDIHASILQWMGNDCTQLNPNLQWWSTGNGSGHETTPPPVLRQLCPHILVQWGRFFMPF